jgi:hypothetical protein
MSNLIEQRDAALARVEELKAVLGDAIIGGNETNREKASADLANAQRTAADLTIAIESVRASEAAAARLAEQAASDRADQERRARIDAANIGLATLGKKGRALDKAIAALDSALDDLASEGDKFLAEHQDIGLHGNVRNFLRTRAWLRDVWCHVKERGNKDLRHYIMANGKILHVITTKARTIEQAIGSEIPDISGAITGKTKKAA